MLPTERVSCLKIFMADRVPPARSEIFSGQKNLVRKLVRPDFFAAKFFLYRFFQFEILKTEKFSGWKLKIPKKSGAKVGKKGVSSVTNSRFRRKSCDTDPALGSENPNFFWPRNFKNQKNFPVESWKSQKNLDWNFSGRIFSGLKSEKSKKVPGERVYGRIFLVENPKCRKIFGRQTNCNARSTGPNTNVQVFLYHVTPLLAPVRPPRGTGRTS